MLHHKVLTLLWSVSIEEPENREIKIILLFICPEICFSDILHDGVWKSGIKRGGMFILRKLNRLTIHF